MAGGRLTELEGCVLGLVWERGPCSAYAIRRELLDSPSPHWSSHASGVYPLLGRLERARLIRSRRHAAGRREGRLYSLTPSGARRLARWLGPPLPAAVVAVPPDPLRTRMYFLGALPEAKRREFLAEAERLLVEHQTRLAATTPRGAGGATRPFGDLAQAGTFKVLKARLEHVRDVGHALDGMVAKSP